MTRMDEIVGRVRAWGGEARGWAERRGLDWRHGVVAGGVLAAGVVVAGLASAASGGRSVVDAGERMKIEIVQPVEPVFTAGPVMEVGTLVDGFDPSLTPLTAPPDPMLEEDGTGEDETKPASDLVRRFSSSLQKVSPREERSPPPRIRREERAFGFDEPGPDRQAEREARRAWRDRIEAERRAEREGRDADRAEPPHGDVETKPVG